MMLALPDEQTLYQSPYAAADEVRASARYRWNCQRRGPEPFVILQWTHGGHGLFRCEGREHTVPAGTAFVALVPEDAEYRFAPGAAEPWRFSWINFYGQPGWRFWSALRAATGPVIPLAAETEAGSRLAALIADTAARRFSDRYAASAAAYLFCMALCRQLGEPAPPTARLARTAEAVRRVAARRAAPLPTVIKTLAAEAGVSREHFSRVFRMQRGETPGRFLRIQRLQIADEMLRTTSVPLREIALRCGFTSARHLSDAYRAWRGHSPQRTRR